MKKRYPKPKKGAWFVKIRGSYIPCSWQGWLLYVPFIAFLVTVMQATIRDAHSMSDALYQLFVYFVCAGVVMHWIASAKS
jgi:hypothetical protein